RVLREASGDVEEILERRPWPDLVVAGPTYGSGECDERTAHRHVDPHALFDEWVLREIAAHLEAQEVDLGHRAAASHLHAAEAAPGADASGGEDDLVHATDGGRLNRARMLDLAGEYDLEASGGRDGQRNFPEPEQLTSSFTDTAVRFAERQATNLHGSDRWNADHAFGIDDQLL